MTNWKDVAEARGLGIPETDLERLVPVMEKLESDFEKIRELLLHCEAEGE